MKPVILEAHGVTLRCDPEYPGRMTQCWREGRPYEAPLLEHIYRQGFDGLAVDAGASYGNHAVWLAAVCGLAVVAFEPLHHEILLRNVKLNGLTRKVTVAPVALGAESGRARAVSAEKLEVGAGDIPVRTLDSYGLTDVAVVKADVEDMEPDVLRGGEQTIRRDRPVIYAEAHEGQHGRIAAVLLPWGYEMTGEFNSEESVALVEEWVHRG